MKIPNLKLSPLPLAGHLGHSGTAGGTLARERSSVFTELGTMGRLYAPKAPLPLLVSFSCPRTGAPQIQRDKKTL